MKHIAFHRVEAQFSRRNYIILLLLSLWSVALAAPNGAFQLAPLFQDNMVLQQQSNCTIWGKGVPQTTVFIRSSWGKEASTIVQQDGHWATKIPTPKAGGPFQISLRHGTSLLVIRNVLVGEVWLCSGQSNMEMPLEGWPPSDTIANSASEIEHALYPAIRMFTVMRSIEAAPSETCVGTWTECSPVDVRPFSATAFYFGKNLANTLHVPIGLINSSFGGTFIESWMSKEALSTFEEYTSQLKQLDACKENIQSLNEWIIKHPSLVIREQDPLHKYEGLNFQDDRCSARAYNDSAWHEMKLPTYWEQAEIGGFDGAVWFRKSVTIPSTWKGKDLTVRLGPVDDMDETYVNGKKVGGYMADGYWNTDRVYAVAGSLVPDSILQIAVRVIDLRGGGGIWGHGTKMVLVNNADSSSVPIDGLWKFLPVAELKSNIFYIYGAEGNEFSKRPKFPIDFSQDTPSSLFNGMINPFVPFTIKGVIWYQGENNVSNAVRYKKLFPSMIADWRKQFEVGNFPFYYVQIAPYEYGEKSKSQMLREAQFQTLSVKNTGMAVIMDIGNPKNIHPADKEDVGGRLASLALAKTYGKKIPCSGPVYTSMKVIKGKVLLSFDNTGKGLMVKPLRGETNFLIAGEDKVFKKAVVKVEGSKLAVSNSEIAAPVAVRYAWSNTDEATLFNKDGLPSSSFRTDDWNE
jgi:sialate O-acetylesterase